MISIITDVILNEWEDTLLAILRESQDNKDKGNICKAERLLSDAQNMIADINDLDTLRED